MSVVRYVEPAWGGPAALVDQVRAALYPSGQKGAMWSPIDIATLSQDSAGTTPVTAFGQPVGRALDVSGNANHLLQATSTHRPSATSTGLLFDMVDDRIACAGSPWTSDMVMMSLVERASSGIAVTYTSHFGATTGLAAIAQTGAGTAGANGAGSPTTYVDGVLTSGTRGDIAAKWAPDTLVTVDVRNADLSAWTGQLFGFRTGAGSFRRLRRGVFCEVAMMTPTNRALVEAWLREGL